MLHRGMYPVPAPSRAYHPCFTQDSVQAILVVPQGCAIVNSKPYPACLFFWRGRPSTDAPGVQISILQRRRRKHLQHLHAGDPISRSPEGRQPSHGSQQRCIVSSAVDRELVGVTAIRGHGVQNRHVFGRYALVDCRIEELRRTKATTPSSHSRQGASGRRSPGLSAYRLYGLRSYSPAWPA